MNWTKQKAGEPNQAAAASIFYVATFFGLVAGLGQVFIFAFEKFVLRGYIHQSPDILWMAPLADVVFFSVCALLMYPVISCWPRLIPWWLPVFVFASLCYLSLMLMATWMQVIPLVILTIGLAAETTRIIGDHPAGFDKLMRRTLGWVGIASPTKKAKVPEDETSILASDSSLTRRRFLVSTGAAFAGLVLGSRGPDALEDWITLAHLPPAPRDAPNVLLITLDTVRAQSMSLYGYERMTTPNLERLAKKGVLFERAVSTASWTLPSHASMFTGRYPHELSADRKTPLDFAYPTLAEVLSAQGYASAGFVANIEYCTAESGLGQGFLIYDDFEVSLGNFVLACSLGNYLNQRPSLHRLANNWNYLYRKSASEVNAQFLGWLDRKGPRPFFAFLNYFDAHSPYYPPEPFNTLFGPTTPRDSPVAEKWVPRKDIPAAVLRAEMNAYDGAIAYIDHEVGLLFDELDKRGVFDNTLVIIASDHGEEFGEHDLFSHGRSLYLPSLHVPLLILYPARVPTGKSVGQTVSLRDVAATVTELTNLKSNITLPGKSLTRYWANSPGTFDPASEVVFAELKYTGGFPNWFPTSKGNMQSLATSDYHYVKNGDDSEELYNWQADPWEQHDLSATEQGRQQLVYFRTWLKSINAA